MTNQMPASRFLKRTRLGHPQSSTPRPPACSSTRSPSRAASAPTASAKPSAAALSAMTHDARWKSTPPPALLHDFDYELHPSPEEHPFFGIRHPRPSRAGQKKFAPPSSATPSTPAYPAPLPPRDKTLFACDELAGFLTACALVKPTQVHPRCRDRRREKEAQGQGLRPRRQPRRHRQRRSRTRRPPRPAHRLLHRRHARQRRNPRPPGNSTPKLTESGRPIPRVPHWTGNKSGCPGSRI